MSEMGKAMMGTGEASGERRAIQAAEAAIANPLLDEVSMSGARGLLISITGGNDLGLYEVDEAASRIRQEVDEDANIILGATFDQSLDGVVRVSVVATGIDQEKVDVSPEQTATQQRIAEAAQRLRAQATARIQAAAPQPAPAPAPQPVVEAPLEPAPVAAPIPPVAEVELRPVAPKPALYADPPAQPTLFEEPASEFVPPPAEQIVRAPRLPQIQDLPPIAQQQLRAHRGEQPAQGERRKSLLEKLAAFGITRQEDAAPPAPRAAALPSPVAPRVAPPAQTHADYGRPQPRTLAPRAAQGALDPHGRVGAKPAAIEEDQLEIPAFLRRQSS